MGSVIAFPAWQVLTRDEGYAPGDPVALVHPSGRREPVERVLRRRLVASPDPAQPIMQESLVEVASGARFLLRYAGSEDRWDVVPL
jgi:hypothetical protein